MKLQDFLFRILHIWNSKLIPVFPDITGKGARVNTGDSATLTCTITGSSSVPLVTWSRVGDVTLPSDVITSPGQWSSGTQVATLTQKNARSNGTFRCGVEDGAGTKHYVNVDLQVIPGMSLYFRRIFFFLVDINYIYRCLFNQTVGCWLLLRIHGKMHK